MKKKIVMKLPEKKGIAVEVDGKKIMAQIGESKGILEDNFHPKWKLMDNLMKGIKSMGAYTEEWQSNMSSNLLFGIVTQEISLIMNAIYPKTDFYSFEPEEDTDGAMRSVEVHKKIMEIQAKDMHLYKSIYWSVMDSLVYSVGWLKLEWEFDEKEKQFLDFTSGKIVPVEEKEKIDRPCVRNVSPFNIFFDVNATSMEDCKWVAELKQITKADLQNPVYNTPDAKVLLKELYDKDDDYSFNIYVYYTPKSVTVLNENGLVIRNHHTIYKHNKIPFFPLVKFPLQRSLLGLSTCEMVHDSVNYYDQLLNAYADNMKLAIHKIWLLKSSSDIKQEDMRIHPGKVIGVRSFDELSALPNPAPVSPYNEMENINSQINKVVGNLDQVDDSSNRTATEARISAQRSATKQQSYILYNREEAIKPLLVMWFDLNQQFLDKEKVTALLGKKVSKDLKVENNDVDLSVNAKVIITGESGLVDKTQQLENLQTFMELVMGVAQMPEGIDKQKLLKYVLSNTDMPEDIYAEATEIPQEAPQGKAPQVSAPVNKDKLMNEIDTAAKSIGTNPEGLIQSLSKQLGMPPETIIQQIESMGSLNAFLQSVRGAK